tara:strand:- start:291 stop:557 length:267 start_codon:yes stop_codon:yes gene_type:complete
MSIEYAIHMGQQTIWACLTLAGPVLIVALVVGTVISVFQAVTQIQEMTLVFVPKILSVFLVLSLAGGWMLNSAVSFGTQMFISIGDVE